MFDHLKSRLFPWMAEQPFHPFRSRRQRPLLELLEDRCAPAVFNVNSLADNLMPPAGVVTLRSAIQAANSTPGGNTINLTIAGTYQITLAGTAGETDNAAGEFAILPTGGNLTIQNTSEGTVIVDGGDLNNRVLDINPANAAANITVTMQGFTIQNGIATSTTNPDGPDASGGGIRDQGNVNLTLTNMVIRNNSATADGGGVAMENSTGSTFWTLMFNKTTVSDNHAGDSGGGIETDGKGAVSINAGCVIAGNMALVQGGGVYLEGIANAVSSVAITNPGGDYLTAPLVTFSAPPSGTTATGVATVNVRGQVTGVIITNSGSGYTSGPPTITFSPSPDNNTAAATATVVASQSANLTMTGTVVVSNKATGKGNVIGGILSATGIGGGISNAGDGAVTTNASTIADNFAASNGGGYSDQDNGLGTLTVSNSLFMNNSACASGGGIQVSGPRASGHAGGARRVGEGAQRDRRTAGRGSWDCRQLRGTRSRGQGLVPDLPGTHGHERGGEFLGKAAGDANTRTGPQPGPGQRRVLQSCTDARLQRIGEFAVRAGALLLAAQQDSKQCRNQFLAQLTSHAGATGHGNRLLAKPGISHGHR
jgi:hypothetical protein